MSLKLVGILILVLKGVESVVSTMGRTTLKKPRVLGIRKRHRKSCSTTLGLRYACQCTLMEMATSQSKHQSLNSDSLSMASIYCVKKHYGVIQSVMLALIFMFKIPRVAQSLHIASGITVDGMETEAT